LISISPNPAGDFINLSAMDIRINSVRLFNLIGEEIWFSNLGDGSLSSNPDRSAGDCKRMYFVVEL
jgi:hypothetical protein